MVESTLNYLAVMEERPTYYRYEPPAGTPWRNTRGDRRTMPIHDARSVVPQPSLEREGFELVRHVTGLEDLYDPEAVRRVYYPEIEQLVASSTGATRVLAFDHNVRSSTRDEQGRQGVYEPVRYAHNDYTEASGPQRVRDLVEADEADRLLQNRFAVINVWKPIRGPVQTAPLAVCDARTIASEELVATDLKYRDRTGEVYSLRFGAAHRWFYFPQMQAAEALLLKCFDSASGRARYTAHTAFDDPGAAPDAPARESVEVRTLAFF